MLRRTSDSALGKLIIYSRQTRFHLGNYEWVGRKFMQKGTAGWESWTKIEVAFECLNAVDHWVTVASSNKVYRTYQTNE